MEWISYGMFWTSAVIAGITITATAINYFVYRINIDPNVIVYADVDDARPTIIVLTIKNIGRGVALNVHFEYSEPIPANAFGFEGASKPENMSNGPIITGIPSLAPGAKRIITWGQYGGLNKGIEDRVISITAIYKSKPISFLWPRCHRTESLIDIKSFEYTKDTTTNWDKKQPEATEQIATILKKLVSNKT